MLSFLFEQYGYYPKSFINNSFEIDNWVFKLIEIVEDNGYIDQIDNFIFVIRDAFLNNSPYIIKNRMGEKISYYDGKGFVLICILKSSVDIEQLNRFHVLLKEENKNVDLKKICLLWEKKMNFIENECLALLKSDNASYENNLKIVLFCLGLCQNSIQYLSDIVMDYDGFVNNLTITHKRLSSFNSFEMFNPFNFVVDHPLRDYIELYKNDIIDFDTLIESLEYYQLDSKLASVIIARLLYPSFVFDCLEENYYSSNQNLKINYNIEKETLKIKKVYWYYKKKYQIRPILWLDNN